VPGNQSWPILLVHTPHRATRTAPTTFTSVVDASRLARPDLSHQPSAIRHALFAHQTCTFQLLEVGELWCGVTLVIAAPFESLIQCLAPALVRCQAWKRHLLQKQRPITSILATTWRRPIVPDDSGTVEASTRCCNLKLGQLGVPICSRWLPLRPG
jgi:hypothetical protein